jgi:O-acetyl-ADP-ribose deacetylase (regulator of RNase III)
MPIKVKQCDIFILDVEAIVNPVNCVGVSGAGLALEFRNRYPENYTKYRSACRKKLLLPGRVFVTKTQTETYPWYIFNFPTKNHWRDKSSYSGIREGLQVLKLEVEQGKISSIAIPALGCGLGGLKWQNVEETIKEILANSSAEIILVPPCEI